MRGRRFAVVAAAGLLAGCGQPSPDLFIVTRSGEGPNDDITLVVNDGGTVSCDGGAPRRLDGDRLLRARELSRELAAAADLGLELPARDDALLTYSARLEAGTVSFSDASPNRPASLNRLMGFVADVSEKVCGVER